MKKFDVVIVDDEYLLADLIENYLQKFEQFNLIAKFNDAMEALSFFKNNDVDLVFLDIEMPTMNGVDLAKFVPKKAKIVFTTAYSEYAIQGFDLNALDYLLKPISFVRFTESIHRFFNASAKRIDISSKNHNLMIKADGDLHQVLAEKVIYLQSLREYLKYQLSDNRLIVYGSLSKEEERLSVLGFIRTHKSYLINKTHIYKISGNQIHMSNGDIIPIGRTYKSNLNALINPS
ncbi:MAG: response regulator transcription factor [Flavobacteriales bacterium]|nr:response regulator transcription factor [Flavobacteriales bacterium]MCB9197756.1 response regulator transcription factor [Flavobacteriales bacterium]